MMDIAMDYIILVQNFQARSNVVELEPAISCDAVMYWTW